MYTNLYFDVPGYGFADHNFRSFPNFRIEKVPQSQIERLLKGSCVVPDSKANPEAYDGYAEADSELGSIFEETLQHKACVVFFRAEPSLPAVERDYYLSKLCQFLWLIVMECYGFRLQSEPNLNPPDHHFFDVFLDSIRDDRLLDLAYFDWQQFRQVLCAPCPAEGGRDMLQALGDLHSFLPRASHRASAPRTRRRTQQRAVESPAAAIRRRVAEVNRDAGRDGALSHGELCKRLDAHGIPLPPNATWNSGGSWHSAYKKRRGPVTRWLSETLHKNST